MGGSIAATIYGLISLGVAAFVVPPAIRSQLLKPALVFWAIALVIMMFIGDRLTVLLLIAAVATVFALRTQHRAALYLLIVPAVPISMFANLPFPGVNYLLTLNHLKLASLVVLAPLLFIAARKPDRGFGNPLGDAAIFGYALYTAIMLMLSASAFDASAVTTSLRAFVDMLLILVIPFFAISRAIKSEADLQECLKAMFAASAILACVATISTIKDWDYYRHIEPIWVYTPRDYRYGFQRMAATANTHSLGYICGFGAVLLVYLRSSAKIRSSWFLALFVLLVFGMFVTISRGAMLGTIVALACYLMFTRDNVGKRVAAASAVSAAAIAGAIYILQGDTQAVDPFSTVEYRRLLLDTSLQFISEHLWFGDPNFIQDRRFLPLLQGQGIIDITNFYLQVLLAHGTVGFVLLFLSPFVYLLRQVKALFSPAVTFRNERAQLDRQRALLCSGMIGWLALVTTTSDVGLTFYLGVVLMALMRAAFSLDPRRAAQRKAAAKPGRIERRESVPRPAMAGGGAVAI